MPEIKHKFDKKRLFFFEILGLFFFFRLKVIFSPMCLQNKNFDLRPKNWKTLNILEHFWYLGHFHNPTRTYFFMTKKICKKKEKKMKFLIFWKKFGKKFFSPNFHFSSPHSSASRCARNIMRVWKMFSELWRIQKNKKRAIKNCKTYCKFH